MSKQLIDGVNEILKKAGVLDSDVGVLTSLTDSGRQTQIDIAIQSLNEVVDDLYSISRMAKPKQMREATITLVSGTKDYGIHSQSIMLRREYHLIDQTNNHIIEIVEDFRELVFNDLDQDDTGLPHFAAISPVDGRLYFDRTPTANEAGRVYRYRYDRDMALDSKDDAFPFNDSVFRSVIVAANERYNLNRRNEFAGDLYRDAMARAARYLREIPPRASYGKQAVGPNLTDPFSDNVTSR